VQVAVSDIPPAAAAAAAAEANRQWLQVDGMYLHLCCMHWVEQGKRPPLHSALGLFGCSMLLLLCAFTASKFQQEEITPLQAVM
jgi:hypothetical protein